MQSSKRMRFVGRLVGVVVVCAAALGWGWLVGVKLAEPSIASPVVVMGGVE